MTRAEVRERGVTWASGCNEGGVEWQHAGRKSERME